MLIALIALAAAAGAQVVPNPVNPQVPPSFSTGDCVSSTLSFNKDSVYLLAGSDAARYSVDRSKYDWTLDYGDATFSGSTASLNLLRPTGASSTTPGQSARISTTRYVRYAKITARFKPATAAGVVTTFITFSDKQQMANISGELTQDEIDWEIVGKNPARPETNVFTIRTQDLERGLHGGPIGSDIDPSVAHDFTIDWRSDRIVWSIDGVVMRTLLKSEARAVRNASIPSGLPWFPELASRVQISIWDGSITQGSWAGSPVPWDSSNKFSAPFEYITIDCYDDKNNVVPRWSTDGSGRDTIETPPQVDPLPTDNRQKGTHGSAAIGMFSLVSVLAAACTAAMAAWAVL